MSGWPSHNPSSILARWGSLDGGGIDAAIVLDYGFDQMQFRVDPATSANLIVSSTDGAFSLTLENMRAYASYGIEYLVLKDRTVSRDEMISLAGPASGGGGGGGGGGWEQLAPIVLDLDHDGLELIAPNQSRVHCDWDDDGVKEQTGWVGPDDGFLVFDRDGDGNITRVDEIAFGVVESRKGPFISDLEGLKLFDTNGNGLLDSGDFEFGRFGVWRDRNSNGLVDDGERQSLASLGFSSLSLTGDLTGEKRHPNSNVIYATTEVQLADGETFQAGDVLLGYKDREEPGHDGDVFHGAMPFLPPSSPLDMLISQIEIV